MYMGRGASPRLTGATKQRQKREHFGKNGDT